MKIKILMVLTLISLFINGCASTADNMDLKGAKMMANSPNLFGKTKVVQIGVVVRDVEKSAKNYAEFFGVEVPKIIISETEDKAKTRYYGKPTKARVRQAFFNFDNISLELLEPVDGPSTWKDFLDSKGEGLHHIAFEVKDMDDKIAQMKDRGMPLSQQGGWTGGSGGRYAYFESEKKLAMILELLENF
jgi:methylmalonyl-CoA/ethylmalonyl-CoA epimerase